MRKPFNSKYIGKIITNLRFNPNNDPLKYNSTEPIYYYEEAVRLLKVYKETGDVAWVWNAILCLIMVLYLGTVDNKE